MAGRERRATPVRVLFFVCFFHTPCSLSVQAHGMCLWLYIITQSAIEYVCVYSDAHVSAQLKQP